MHGTGMLRRGQVVRMRRQQAPLGLVGWSGKETAIVAWIYVLAAGLLEVIWAVGLKYTDGFTRLWPSVVTVVTFAGSLFLLALAVRTIPIGTAYAMFVGIGAVGAAVLGIILFGESTDAGRIFFLTLLIVSLIGLRLTSGPA
jgi:quaternary ammonium compound-resistance protein SugE